MSGLSVTEVLAHPARPHPRRRQDITDRAQLLAQSTAETVEGTLKTQQAAEGA